MCAMYSKITSHISTMAHIHKEAISRSFYRHHRMGTISRFLFKKGRKHKEIRKSNILTKKCIDSQCICKNTHEKEISGIFRRERIGAI